MSVTGMIDPVLGCAGWLYLSLRADADVVADGADLVIGGSAKAVRVRRPSPGLAGALRMLVTDPVLPATLVATVAAGSAPLATGPLVTGPLVTGPLVAPGQAWSDAAGDLARLRRVLAVLDSLLCRTVVDTAASGRRLVTVVPVSAGAVLAAAVPTAVGTGAVGTVGLRDCVRLSRFAYLRRPDVTTAGGRGGGGGRGLLVLESPLAAFRAVLHCPGVAAMVAACAAGGTVHTAVQTAVAPVHATAGPTDGGGLTPSSARLVLDLLVAAGLLESAGPDPAGQSDSSQSTGQQAAEDDPESPLGLWDFHDLLFHSRSRPGHSDQPIGAYFRHAASSPEPSPLPIAPSQLPGAAGDGGDGVERLIDLVSPLWPDVLARDVTLTDALERRRSVRSYPQEPITLAELAELLYRSARVRGLTPATVGVAYTAVDRPYPAGGSMGELELYLSVARCDGLAAGVYHYDAAGHRLRLLDTADADRRALLAGAVAATAGAVEPQVLVTITARFARMAWKYSGIAYATTLKQVGALYQTMYLVATAMGLAPCGLGSGDTALAARAFGTEWTAESSVGEFLLGSRPAGVAAGPHAFADVVRSSRVPARC
ncbi:SagB family peptide dehydrogenase [Frankia sp. Cr2]|uniref:SagB/ThcOx family dehydrogenase n=1 Tax=Frankia sp. Cr2 TaxID=3073932 RepID=UPI002AD51B84|nr:SagB family peptide dehydrogenase [Frankia sp. Cr2]